MVSKCRMKRQTFNKVVQRAQTSKFAVAEAVFGLPSVVRQHVEADLEWRHTAKHYDSASGRAYFFDRRAKGLIVWSWCCLASSHEAAQLLSSLDSLDSALDAETASALFERATGRSVNEPQPSYRY
jgi:hypothetical protein